MQEAFTHLRDNGIVPWAWIRDDRRTLSVWRYADSVADYVADSIEGARFAQVPQAAHLPSLERADEINALLLAFLADG